MITFADSNFTMPGIDPMVYIGKNAVVGCPEDDRDTYQFQDTISFVRFGYAMDMNLEQRTESLVEVFDESQLGKDITTLDRAAEVLRQAISKSDELGHPMLSVAKGEWIAARSETWVDIDENVDEHDIE